MSDTRALLVTLAALAASVVGVALAEPWRVRPWLDEGGPVEGLSAIVAGAAACAGLISLARQARRRGGRPTRTAWRDAVGVGVVAVVVAGEELSWGEGLWWHAATRERSQRVDAIHDVLNLVSTRVPVEVLAVVVGVVGVVVTASLWRAGSVWRRVGLSAGLLAAAAALDTLHRPGVTWLSVEEVGELLAGVWLCRAGLGVGRDDADAL